MKTKTWLRLYHEFADDPKIQMLAFEDQRHYVMILCLKGRGVLESATPNADYRERMVAKALGLDPLTAREVKFRLMEPGLIDDQWQPVAWASRQYESDSSTSRVQKHREEKRKRFGNVSSRHEPEPGGQLVDRSGNVSVTAQIRAEQSENPPSGDSLEAKSADGRASPTGSPAAPSPAPAPAPAGADGKKSGKGKPPPEPAPFDERTAFAAWWQVVTSEAVGPAQVLGITRERIERLDQLPTYARTHIEPVARDLTTWAVEEWRKAWPNCRRADASIEAEIRSRMQRELKVITPATPAELQAQKDAA